MNKKQIMVLRVLIALLIPVFLFNLYEIGKWKESTEPIYSSTEAQERERLVNLSGATEVLLLALAGALILFFRDKKREIK